MTSGNDAGHTSVGVAIGTIPGDGGAANISFRVTISNPLPSGVTQVSNQGSVSSAGLPTMVTDDPSQSGTSDPTVVPVTASPAVAATKRYFLAVDADNNGRPSPGDTLLYQVMIANNGNQAAASGFLDDLLDTNTALVVGSVQATQGTVVRGNTAGDAVVQVNVGTIPGGGSVTVSYRVTIDNPLPPGVTRVINQGLVTGGNFPVVLTDDPDTPTANDPLVVPVTANPILRVSKSDTLFADNDANGVPSAGDELLYRVVIQNMGYAQATSVVFSDTVDGNTSLVIGSVATSLGAVTTGNGAGDAGVAVNVGSLSGGGSATVSFRVRIANPLPTGVTRVANQGLVSSAQLPPVRTDDPQTPVVGDPTQTPVTAAPALAATKSARLLVDADGNGKPSPGDTLLYQVALRNTGNMAATGVVFNDIPDSNTALVVGSVQTGIGSVTTGNNVGDTNVSVNAGVIPVDAVANISFRVTIKKPLAAGVRQVANQGVAQSNGLPELVTDDPATPAGSDPTVTPVIEAPALAASKTARLVVDADGNGVPSPGDTLLYQVSVANRGNAAATGVVFSDMPGANTTLIVGSVQASPGTVVTGNVTGDVAVQVNIGALPSGESASISFRARVVNPLPAGVTRVSNQGFVSSNQLPTIPTDDPQTPAAADPTTRPVVSTPVLTVDKAAILAVDADRNGVPSQGDTLLYRVTIANLGNTAASGVVFTDTPGANTALVNGSVRTGAGTVTSGNGAGQTRVAVIIGVLPAGASVDVSFRVRINNPLPTGVTAVANQGLACSAQLPCVLSNDPDTLAEGDPTVTPVTLAPVLKAQKSDAVLVDADRNGMPSAGDILLYRVTLVNDGNAAATSVLFDDAPDSNTALIVGSVQTTAGTVAKGNTAGDTAVRVAVGTLPGGSSAEVTFRVRIANPLPAGVTQVANQGVVNGNQLPAVSTDDPRTAIPDDPTVTPVIAAPALSAVKRVALFTDVSGDGVPSPGDTLLYQVSIANDGNASATGVVFYDTPDPNAPLVVGSVQATAGTVITGNGTGHTQVSVIIGPLAAGETVNISFRVRISNPLPAGVTHVANQGVVHSNEMPTVFTDDPGTPLPADPTATPVAVAPRLSASKRATLAVDADGNGSPSSGDTLLYQITLVNGGGAAANGVVFDDVPGAYTNLVVGSVQASLGSVTSGNTAGNTSVRVSVGAIPPGGAVNISFRVTIGTLPSGVNQVANQGVVTASGLPGLPTDDPDTPGTEDPDDHRRLSQAVAEDDQGSVFLLDPDQDGKPSPGDQLVYVLTIANDGNTPATNVFFDDRPDSNTALVVGSALANPGTVITGNTTGDTSVRASLGTIPPGGKVRVRFAVRINNPLPAGVTQLANQGFVSSNELPVVPSDDPSTPQANDPSVTPVGGAPSLAADKQDTLVVDADGNGAPTPGDTLEYRVTIANRGNGAATDVVFTDAPDPNTTLVTGSVQTTAGAVVVGNSASDMSVAVNVGTIPGRGGRVTVSFRVRINTPLPGDVTQVANQGGISSEELPCVLTNDPDTVQAGDPTRTPVIMAPLLAANKTDALAVDADRNGYPSPGDTLLYQVTIRNQGSSVASGIVFTDAPANGLALVVGSVQSDAGLVLSGNTPGNTSVRVEIDALPAGQAARITFRVTIANPLPPNVTIVTNQGIVSSAQMPPVPTDDPDTPAAPDGTQTPVTPAPILTAQKVGSLVVDLDRNGVASTGDTLLYQVTIANAGNAAMTGVRFTDTPDANTTLVAGSVQTSLGVVSRGNGAGDTSVSVDIAGIPPRGSATISFRVRVNSSLSSGATQVANQGAVTSQQLPQVLTDDPSTPAPNDPTATPVTVSCNTPADLYEPDNFYTVAPAQPADGSTTEHTLHVMGDKDWIKFYGYGGQLYAVTTSRLSADVDTTLQLYGNPELPPMATNDDYLPDSKASRVVWTVPTNGWYYARVSHFDTSYNPKRSPVCGNGFLVSVETMRPALTIIKTAEDVNGGPLYGGDEILYQITVQNPLKTAQNGVVISDALPARTTYVAGSAQVSLGNVSGPDPLLANIGTLLPGQSATLVFRVKVNADAIGQTILNTAQATSGSQATPVTAGPVGPAPSGVVQPGTQALGISKTAEDMNGMPLYAGDEILYRVTVVNLLGVEQTGIVVNDAVPNYTTYVAGSAQASQGTMSGPNPLQVAVGTLQPGQSATLAFRVRVNEGVAGQRILNTGHATSDVQRTPVIAGPVEPQPVGGLVQPARQALGIRKTALDLNGGPLFSRDQTCTGSPSRTCFRPRRRTWSSPMRCRCTPPTCPARRR